MCPWVTRLHIDRCLCSADLCRSVSHSTLDTTGRRGFSPLPGSAPWQARSHGRASSHRIGYIRFAALPASKICLKFLLLNWEVGLAHYMCHASNTASQRVRSAYPFAFRLSLLGFHSRHRHRSHHHHHHLYSSKTHNTKALIENCGQDKLGNSTYSCPKNRHKSTGIKTIKHKNN